ncbi:MAG: TrmH family RNA methyltransferase [Alphaproteobacteria bacterium]
MSFTGGRTAFVMGAEGKGLRRLVADNCDLMAKLPTNPDFPTLNVSTAAAVTLYEWCRQNAS